VEKFLQDFKKQAGVPYFSVVSQKITPNEKSKLIFFLKALKIDNLFQG